MDQSDSSELWRETLIILKRVNGLCVGTGGPLLLNIFPTTLQHLLKCFFNLLEYDLMKV